MPLYNTGSGFVYYLSGRPEYGPPTEPSVDLGRLIRGLRLQYLASRASESPYLAWDYKVALAQAAFEDFVDQYGLDTYRGDPEVIDQIQWRFFAPYKIPDPRGALAWVEYYTKHLGGARF